MNSLEFIYESNKIEGIKRPPTPEEILEFHRFMNLPMIGVGELEHFVSVYQPNARLRDTVGLNVMVGGYYPPRGGVEIKTRLMDIVNDAIVGRNYSNTACSIHQRYEKLHPFTDCNGRSGRMLWMWMMKEAPLGFLHTWYYQSLSV